MAEEIISVELRAATEGVLRAWTRNCSMRMQAVLCTVIRGCDGFPKSDPSKTMLRALRYVILNPSCEAKYDDPTKFTTFMGHEPNWQERTEEWLADLDPYPFHFVQHVAHAAHVVAVYHPDPQTHIYWRGVYRKIIEDGMHAVVEPDEVMLERLRDR